jgi:hypothetical protein
MAGHIGKRREDNYRYIFFLRGLLICAEKAESN